MKKYAIFVNSNGGYIPFLNALLNSIDRYKLDVDVHLLHYECPAKYLEEVQKSFNYNVILTEIKRDDFNIHEFNERNNNLFIKQSRFKYIREKGMEYDAICMLDADMFVTTSNFMNLFDLVSGTNKLIGCNERFKWVFDKKYMLNGKQIFDTPVKAHKFHCSVPIIFDLKKWTEVFDYYNQMAYNAFETDPAGKILKPVGDIYCWNISVYKNNRQNDVVLFPMAQMAQVHHTYAHPWTRLEKTGEGNWITYEGDEVFSIHGRVGNKGWYEGQMRGMEKLITEFQINKDFTNVVKSTLRNIIREWIDLNYNHKLNLGNYIPKEQYTVLLEDK